MMNNTVFSRLSSWFKPGDNADAPRDLPLENENATLSTTFDDTAAPITVTTFLKPWAKRDAALAQLQNGFDTLTEVMSAVKDNLQRQSARQDELLRILAHLPEAIRAIPENARLQSETLKVVGEQLKHHNTHYHKLGEVLDKVSDSAASQHKTLDALHDRVETIAEHDRSLADNMRSVSTAMETLSQNAQSSTQVLDQLKSYALDRDVRLQLKLHRQQIRFTAILAVAILLSVSALTTVALLHWKVI